MSLPQNLIDRLQRLKGLDDETIFEIFRAEGWIKKRVSNDIPFFLVSPDGKYIIKQSFHPRRPSKTPYDSYKIPTFEVESLIGKRYPWALQPLAQRDPASRKEAWAFFKPISQRTAMLDIHSDNVAMYQGKPVLIDW